MASIDSQDIDGDREMSCTEGSLDDSGEHYQKIDTSGPGRDSSTGPYGSGDLVAEGTETYAASLDPTTRVYLRDTSTREVELVLGAKSGGERAVADGPSVCTIASTGSLEVPDQVLRDEQLRDPSVTGISEFLRSGKLPQDKTRARKIALQSPQFALVDGILFYINPKTRHKRAVVPSCLQHKILQETHAGKYSGHFSGRRLYATLCSSWWWEGMYSDAEKFASSCPECIVATGTGRKIKPPLQPIPVQRPFQVLGIDVMDLPLTEKRNRHVVVIQDLFTKCPLVFPVPDQKALRIAKLIAEEVVPFFGVPECLLSDRGTNLLSHLVIDLCRILGIKKLNTTAYHPQCDGAVERFNRTLKSILRKHAARF